MECGQHAIASLGERQGNLRSQPRFGCPARGDENAERGAWLSGGARAIEHNRQGAVEGFD